MSDSVGLETPVLDAAEAVVRAADDLGVKLTEKPLIIQDSAGRQSTTILTHDISRTPIESRLMCDRKELLILTIRPSRLTLN